MPYWQKSVRAIRRLPWSYVATPHLRRQIRLAISPMSKRRVQFVGTVVTLERRNSISLLDPAISRSGDHVAMCSWCKSVLLPDGRFAEVEDAIERLRVVPADVMPAVSQTTCPACSLAKSRERRDSSCRWVPLCNSVRQILFQSISTSHFSLSARRLLRHGENGQPRIPPSYGGQPAQHRCVWPCGLPACLPMRLKPANPQRTCR